MIRVASCVSGTMYDRFPIYSFRVRTHARREKEGIGYCEKVIP